MESFNVRSELFAASFMSGNFCQLSLRSLLVRGASMRDKLDTKR